MELILRKKAKLQGLQYYFTGNPCKHGHIDKRNVSNGVCLSCVKTLNLKYRLKNVNKLKILKNNHYVENKQLYNDRAKKWKLDNTQKSNEWIATWKYKNIDKVKENNKEYKLRNKNSANRRSSKLNRIPKWLTNSDKNIINGIYKISSRITKETGIKHHVDHIIPLQGKFVSGLHVSDNLQILTAKANTSKGNYFAVN